MHKQEQSKVRAGGRQRGYQKPGRVKRQAANGQSHINSPVYKQGKHTQGKRSEMSVCTSLLFTLLFIKSQYTVFCFLFLYILLFFFAHLVVFLHISLSFAHLIVFCTSYCFLHILLFCTFLFHCTFYSYFSFSYHMYALVLCYLYNLYSYCFALSLSGPDSIAFHF